MKGPVERVVVTLDDASENRTAIETAARLAVRTKAPLRGIFIEDEDLLHLAALPFTYQVVHGGGRRQLNRREVELHLRAAAERSRRELVAAAKRHSVASSFEIVRGASSATLAVVGESDLIVAGGRTRPVGGHFRVDCRWWSAIAVAPGPFLLARHDGTATGSVVVLLRDRSPAAERLLATGSQIAEAEGIGLIVICPRALAGSNGFEKWLAELVGETPVRIEIAPDEPNALDRRVGELNCRLLAIEAGITEGRADRLRDLAGRFAYDLLIVR